MSDPEATARSYYRALDEPAYDDLAALLAPGFVHDRPDRTIEGCDRFVRFMRDERPQKDTSHPVDAVYGASDEDLAVRGRLLDAGGDPIARFVDVFTLRDGRITRIRTYTR